MMKLNGINILLRQNFKNGLERVAKNLKSLENKM